MNLFVKGKGSINLTRKNFVSQGGEGYIYAKGNEAYKIYIDPTKMIPPAKIGELATITNPKVIKPNNILLSKKNQPLGYTMRYLTKTHALCQLFTKAFRDRNNITPQKVISLVKDMQDTVNHIHQNKILIVDMNEMNFLVDDKFKEVFFIDVDSYQTRSFPATAIMESIRDRHSDTFNEGTDWFSFAVVTFQMFMGVHPYKGKHPKIKSLNDRMVNNISVLNPGVRIPGLCPPVTVIPEVYRNWYSAIFDSGKRIPPPGDIVQAIVVIPTIKKITGDKFVIIKEIKKFDNNITDIHRSNGTEIAVLENNIEWRGQKRDKKAGCQIVFTPKLNHAIRCNIENGVLELFDLNTNTILPGAWVTAKAITEYNNNLYIQSGENILELSITEIGNKIIPSVKIVGNILEKSAYMFDGVVIQTLFEACHASVFPETGKCYQLRIKELDGLRIVDAKYDNRLLMIIGFKDGKYQKLIFRIDKLYHSYNVWKINKDLQVPDINFVALDNGIIVQINENEKLDIFTIDGTQGKEIESNNISSNMRLHKNGTNVMFSRDNILYSIKTQ